MRNLSFNTTVILSLCGHILGFTFIQPTLGNIFQKSEWLKIFFLGSLFNQKDLLFSVDNDLLKEKRFFVNINIEE
ncbi:MAG: hypothetical protein NC826_00470 [Candidatus Omnitrophica bacterium]|nr:hypothetical protein [Candidatus Omnitrophota bacterium]